jgi:receptor-type tyrosine-protein phosphatase N
VKPKVSSLDEALLIVLSLENLLQLPRDSFSDISVYNGDINFHVDDRFTHLNATTVAASTLAFADELQNRTGHRVVEAGIGHVTRAYVSVMDASVIRSRYFFLMLVLCGVIAGVLLAVIVLYFIRRHLKSRDKLQSNGESGHPGADISKEYQELCRQHMMSKVCDKTPDLVGRVGSITAMEVALQHSPSSRSSTSSWSEEPVTTSMDILTGHMVLSYMEDHLKTKDRLENEWESLSTYEPELSDISYAFLPINEQKNRYLDILPYDHSRVILNSQSNQHGSDYINASMITDHDPRSPAYIITQSPLLNTAADFWQMVWEQGSVVIVNLCKLVENGSLVCYRYWPTEGCIRCHMYEVHLVSEHIWCEDYLIRSFYLKNIQTNETRTVTQFHFMTWPELGIPSSSKSLLDFRRKVNKSYRGRSCPIVVHCSDGAGRSGTYCLIDMVLNRINKGAKELDIAATLEHIRDQRMQLVKTKEQFEFVLMTVAEEVHAILKALPQ